MKRLTTFVLIASLMMMLIGMTSCEEEKTCVRCGTEFVIDWELAKTLDTAKAQRLNVPYDQELANRFGQDTARMVGLYCLEYGYTTLDSEAILDTIRIRNENPIRTAFLSIQCTEVGTVKETKEFEWKDPTE